MKMITTATAEKLVEFALKHNAVIEQKEFKEFDRHLILTERGLVSLKSPKDSTDTYCAKDCSLQEFHGMDNKLDVLKKEHTQIRIDGDMTDVYVQTRD